MELIKLRHTKGRTVPEVKTGKLKKPAQAIAELPDDAFQAAGIFSEKLNRAMDKVVHHYEKQNEVIERLMALIALPENPTIEDLKTLSIVLRDAVPLVKENGEFQLQALKDVQRLIQHVTIEVQEGFDERYYNLHSTAGHDLLKILSRRPLSWQVRRLINGAKLLETALENFPEGAGLSEPMLNSTEEVKSILTAVKRDIEGIKPVRKECKL